MKFINTREKEERRVATESKEHTSPCSYSPFLVRRKKARMKKRNKVCFLLKNSMILCLSSPPLERKEDFSCFGLCMRSACTSRLHAAERERCRKRRFCFSIPLEYTTLNDWIYACTVPHSEQLGVYTPEDGKKERESDRAREILLSVISRNSRAHWVCVCVYIHPKRR